MQEYEDKQNQDGTLSYRFGLFLWDYVSVYGHAE